MNIGASMKNHKPVYILSGYLGSGKTTLLNRILKESHGKRFAVIVNEFGEVGLDGSLISSSQDFVKMDNGCLCCALNEELVETIDKLVKRDDYEAIVLETTGIADPLPISWTFFREQFVGHFRFGGIVTVIDALHYEDMFDLSEEALIQLERADFVYLSKTDLCSSERIEKVKNYIQSQNPNARLVDQKDQKAIELLFDTGSDLELKNLKEHIHDHGHDYQSFCVELNNKAVSLDDMEDFFEALPKNIFRAKAAFLEKNGDEYYIMHSVCGRVEFYKSELDIEKPVVIFIGKDFDAKELEKSFYEKVL